MLSSPSNQRHPHLHAFLFTCIFSKLEMYTHMFKRLHVSNMQIYFFVHIVTHLIFEVTCFHVVQLYPRLNQ